MKTLKTILFTLFLTTSMQAQTDLVEYVPGSTVKICQLVGDYDRQRQAQTQNLTESRYGLVSTDLGVPFYHNGRTFVLFGDSWGTPGGDAIAYTTDTHPEDGISLEFITDETGTYKPVILPEISQDDFEVPMEGVSVDGNMYTYHTTDHSSSVMMGRSVVAVSRNDGQTFTYLYDLSDKHFINVSIVKVNLWEEQGFPVDKGYGLVLFGSGTYRQSDVRLAFQEAEQIGTGESLRYFTGLDPDGDPLWSEHEDDAAPLFSHPCVGELSVTYNPYIRKWIMLYNGDPPRGINFRTADAPWGPWSQARLLFDPWLDNGYCHFMHVNWQYSQCDSVHDPGRENEWGGEYGPYQFEELATGNDSTTTIYYTLSTWNPYTVVLMKSALKRSKSPVSTVNSPVIPAGFHLEQNVPNPFNAATRIIYNLPLASDVILTIYNASGQKVETILNEFQYAGKHAISWRPAEITSGLYICQLQAGTFLAHRKMIVLK